MRFVHGLLTLAAACTTGGGDGGGGGGPDGGGQLGGHPEDAVVFPQVVHTGHDGGAHQFQVPVSTDLSNQIAGEVTWASDDPGIATIVAVDTPDGVPATRGVWAMITTASSGQTSVSATIGAYSPSAEVLVAAYTSEQVTAGEARYTTDGADDRQACASCHQEAGGADHTPTEMAFHDDAALLVVVTEGHYPDQCLTDEGEPCSCGTDGCSLVPGYVLSVDHSWNLSETEAAGIVPYLRSLPARGF